MHALGCALPGCRWRQDTMARRLQLTIPRQTFAVSLSLFLRGWAKEATCGAGIRKGQPRPRQTHLRRAHKQFGHTPFEHDDMNRRRRAAGFGGQQGVPCTPSLHPSLPAPAMPSARARSRRGLSGGKKVLVTGTCACAGACPPRLSASGVRTTVQRSKPCGNHVPARSKRRSSM